MKINNLRASHPSHSGKGLRSPKAEEPIVRDFVADRAAMKEAAAEFRRRIAVQASPDKDLPTPDEELIGAAAEGGALAVRVLRRERDPKLRRAKLARVKADGRSIACEVCGFNFGTQYGARGEGYIEVHHRLPLHVSGAVTTTLAASHYSASFVIEWSTLASGSALKTCGRSTAVQGPGDHEGSEYRSAAQQPRPAAERGHEACCVAGAAKPPP